MVHQNNHIIQKQVFEVEMENPTDAFQFRNRLGEVFHDIILPRLTDLFDELGPDHKTYRLDQLTIDAGIINKQNWEQNLADKIITEARQAIQLKDPVWSEPVTNRTVVNKEQLSPPYHPIAPVTPSEEVEQDEKENQWRRKEFYEVFEHYLSTGFVTWYAGDQRKVQEGFTDWIMPNATLLNRLAKYLLTADETALLRLVYLLPVNSLNQLIEWLVQEKNSAILKDFLLLKTFLDKLLQPVVASEFHLKRGLYLVFFKWISVADTADSSGFIVRKTLQYVNSFLPEIIPQLTTLVASEISPFFKEFQKILNKHQNEVELIDAVPLHKKDTIETGEIFINNAGLVMLHPFLAQLFEELRLTTKKVFVDEPACMKAVLLTRFMATGEVVAEDHELVLEKILCGLSPDAPILCDLELLEDERKEARDLLAQIIVLWKQNAVQVNGTIEGLQQSFLQRQGKLTQKNNDWSLQVQQLAYDMVLSSLPWSISMIKTPWMKGMLRVEWA